MSKILVVEDDRSLNRAVTLALSKDNHTVFSAYSKKECWEVLKFNVVDFILLDVSLPDGTGLEICKELRKTSSLPVMFFSASDTETDMIKGFDVGCDDYIAKPFSLEILKHKVNAMLTRKNIDEVECKSIFNYLDLQINYDKMLVTVKNENMNLTPTEYRLLEILAQNKGKVMTKELILQKLWDNSGNFVDENTLNVNIRRLRKKIESDESKYIVTVFGIGYTFGE